MEKLTDCRQPRHLNVSGRLFIKKYGEILKSGARRPIIVSISKTYGINGTGSRQKYEVEI